MSQSSAARSGPPRLGPFVLRRRLGSGTFGTVWLATEHGNHGFKRRVALKILRRVDDPKRWRAMIREARIAGLLNHPNIVPVHGVHEFGGRWFIAMEYVDGETLQSVWADLAAVGLRIPRSVAVDVAIALCESLHHAWEGRGENDKPQRVVHRDLKPANVLLSARGVVKVVDFGLATVVGLDQEGPRTRIAGTPSYLAPEGWLENGTTGPQLDLWAVGVMLYEMIVGERFFGDIPVLKIPRLLFKRSADTEADRVAETAPALRPLVRRLLSRRPARRPDSALAVAEELRLIRPTLGPAGDLTQFIRLIRAGRIQPNQRVGSLMFMPTLPRDVAADWLPLVELVPADVAPADPAVADHFVWGQSVPPDVVAEIERLASTSSSSSA